jgi:membrane protease subunit HflK
VYTNSSKVLVDVEGGNNMMYLPLDKIIQGMPSSQSKDQMSNSDMSTIADQVINEIRSRQNSSNSVRREGR